MNKYILEELRFFFYVFWKKKALILTKTAFICAFDLNDFFSVVKLMNILVYILIFFIFILHALCKICIKQCSNKQLLQTIY